MEFHSHRLIRLFRLSLQDIFHLIVGTKRGLKDTSGPSVGRRVVILETPAKNSSCVVMLDLEYEDLVNEIFSAFFPVARFVFVSFGYLFLSFRTILLSYPRKHVLSKAVISDSTMFHELIHI